MDAGDWACVILLLAIAAIVYQPWAGKSLPLPDFGTFLPLVDRSQGLFAQLSSVITFYAGEGRLCLFPYLLFVFGANAFGTWAPGWYLTYFALNAVVLGFFWCLLRRMRVPRSAAIVAAALWIPMTATTELWLRPTGEPFALIFFLWALVLATGYRSSINWQRDAIVIAVLCVAVIYSKEILITLLPAGWLVTRVSYGSAKVEWQPWTTRDSFLLKVVASALAVAMIPVGWVALSAGDGSYASGFGESATGAGVLSDRVAMVLLPTKPELGNLRNVVSDPAWFLLLALPNLLWMRLIAAGLWKGRSKLFWPLATAFLWLGIGVAAYAPWTDPQTFYMAPFAIGGMFGAAHVMRWLVEGSRAAAIVTLTVGAALVIISSVEANTRVLRYRMRADLNSGVLESIAESGSSSIGAAVPALPRDQRWGWARHLQGFTTFAGSMRTTASEDLTCDQARTALATERNLVIVSRDRGCGRLSESAIAIDRSTTRAQWPYLWKRHVVADRVYITKSEPRLASLAVRPVQASF